jgi:hypothetical protein
MFKTSDECISKYEKQYLQMNSDVGAFILETLK